MRPLESASGQVLYGCVRYKDALRVFLKHYYNDMAGSVLRSDFTLYMILAYLLLFRLDAMGFDGFRHLISSEDPTKMAHLLNYLTDWSRLEVRSCISSWLLGASKKPFRIWDRALRALLSWWGELQNGEERTVCDDAWRVCR